MRLLRAIRKGARPATLLAAALAGCATAPRPLEAGVSIRVDGMVKTEGLT
jgi:hypothetical protein